MCHWLMVKNKPFHRIHKISWTRLEDYMEKYLFSEPGKLCRYFCLEKSDAVSISTRTCWSYYQPTEAPDVASIDINILNCCKGSWHFKSVHYTFVSFHVFVNQIYVETTGDLFVLNGETTEHGASAEFLPPLDEISNGPFLPKAQFTFFSHSTLQGWAVMENWLKKKHFHMVTGR